MRQDAASAEQRAGWRFCVVAINPAFAGDVSNYLFAASQTHPEVAIIDTTTDTVVGRIALPAIPGDIAALERGHLLAIADKTASQVRLVDVVTQRVTRVMDVPLVPDVLRSNRTGSALAALDLPAGSVSLGSAGNGSFQTVADISGATYMVFVPKGRLLVAHEGGVTIVDATERAAARVAVDSANGPVTDVAVDPGGEYTFVEQPFRGILSVFAANGSMPVAVPHLPAPLGRIVPSQDSQFVIVPIGEKSISVVSTWTLGETASVGIGADADSIGLAFFQSVAAIVSQSKQKIILYDLWAKRLLEIRLPGRPGLGAASSDGSKFYVTLPDTGQVAAIDLSTRRVGHLIDNVGPGVWTMVSATGNEYCHWSRLHQRLARPRALAWSVQQHARLHGGNIVADHVDIGAGIAVRL